MRYWNASYNAGHIFKTRNTLWDKQKQIATSLPKENTELPIAKNLTKPSNPTELPHCRKHFEVRRCRVSVLNNNSVAHKLQNCASQFLDSCHTPTHTIDDDRDDPSGQPLTIACNMLCDFVTMLPTPASCWKIVRPELLTITAVNHFYLPPGSIEPIN